MAVEVWTAARAPPISRVRRTRALPSPSPVAVLFFSSNSLLLLSKNQKKKAKMMWESDRGGQIFPCRGEFSPPSFCARNTGRLEIKNRDSLNRERWRCSYTKNNYYSPSLFTLPTEKHYSPSAYPMTSILTIPEITLNSATGKIPVLGFGTAADPPVGAQTSKTAVLQAIELGYRHFDTAALYNSEQPLGEAIAEALKRRLINSRRELFITSKLWCSDAHPQHVVPALRTTLKNLDMDYIDLYLIHWPVSAKHGKYEYPIKAEDFVPLDFVSVWAAMEECQRIGLTKAIGVSNFSSKKLLEIMATATIPPAVNQVEVNPCWQQKKLIQFCKERGILVVAYAPLGAYRTFYGNNKIMESEVLKQIAEARGKTVAQVALRWAYEQGIVVVMKSFNRDRMRENMDIFDWSLSSEDIGMISEIRQGRACLGLDYTSIYGPYNTIQQLWDEDV